MKLNLYKVLLFIMVFLPIYEDSPLSKYLGAAGYSLVMPLSLVLIFLYVVLYQKLPKNKNLGRLFKLCLGMTIVSYIAIVIWVVLGGRLTVVSEFLPYKALKVALQYFSYPAFIAVILICTRKTGTKYIGKYSFITLVVLTIICIIEKQQSPYAFRSLHFAATFPYWRIRLLTLESSWTAMMIYVYSALSLYWSIVYKKKACLAVSIACSAVLLIYSGSKTLMVAIAITIIVYVIVALRKIRKRTLFALLAAAIALIAFTYIILPSLQQSFNTDITDYSSSSTRIYTSIIGLVIGIVFPFGVGGAVSLGVYQNTLAKYLPTFRRLAPGFNITEIESLIIRQTDDALTVKSGILNSNMYWGIVGTIYLIFTFSKTIGSIRKKRVIYSDMLTTIFWTAFILLFAANMTFDFWLLYAFLLCLDEETNRYVQQQSSSNLS